MRKVAAAGAWFAVPFAVHQEISFLRRHWVVRTLALLATGYFAAPRKLARYAQRIGRRHCSPGRPIKRLRKACAGWRRLTRYMMQHYPEVDRELSRIVFQEHPKRLRELTSTPEWLAYEAAREAAAP
jgi:hypothetical protein